VLVSVVEAESGLRYAVPRLQYSLVDVGIDAGFLETGLLCLCQLGNMTIHGILDDQSKSAGECMAIQCIIVFSYFLIFFGLGTAMAGYGGVTSTYIDDRYFGAGHCEESFTWMSDVIKW